jgi:N-acetylglucosamine-6-phosphate deacetylase
MRRICVVSDATALFCREGEVELAGRGFSVRGGCVRDAGTGRLAGSASSTFEGLGKLREWFGLKDHVLARLGSLFPAEAAGISDLKGSLEVGKDADFCIITPSGEMDRIFIAGEEKRVDG